jgi:hypothetical protein
MPKLPDEAPRVLTVLDTGNDKTFMCAEYHLLHLDLGIRLDEKDTSQVHRYFAEQARNSTQMENDLHPPFSTATGVKDRACKVLFDIWVHADENSPPAQAFRIGTGNEGIVVYIPSENSPSQKDKTFEKPRWSLGPRFALLGMRAIQLAELTLKLTGRSNPYGGTAQLYKKQ